MTGLAAVVRERVGECCCARRCRRDGCSVSMTGFAANSHTLVDMDCDTLPTGAGKRCDFVFVGNDNGRTWVAPIELKSGKLHGKEVAQQLQAGADAASVWLPPDASFTLAPVLAYGSIHKTQRARLRRIRIRLRGQQRQPLVMRCGTALRDRLPAEVG